MCFRKPDWDNPNIAKKEIIENHYISFSKIVSVLPAEQVTYEIFKKMAEKYPEISDPQGKEIFERYIAKSMKGRSRDPLSLNEFLLREDIEQVFQYHMALVCFTGNNFFNPWQIFNLPNEDFPWSRMNPFFCCGDDKDELDYLGGVSQNSLNFIVDLIIASLDLGIASDQAKQEQNVFHPYDFLIVCLMKYANLTTGQVRALCEVYKFSFEESQYPENPGYMLEYEEWMSRSFPLERKIIGDQVLREIIQKIISVKLKEKTITTYAHLSIKGLLSWKKKMGNKDEGLFSRFLWSIVDFVITNDLEHTFNYSILEIFQYISDEQKLVLLKEHILRGGTIDVDIKDKDQKKEKQWKELVDFLIASPKDDNEGFGLFGSAYSDALSGAIQDSIRSANEEIEKKKREKEEENRERNERNEADIAEMKKK